MAQVFRDRCLNTYRQSGPPGVFALWALTLSDWFKTVLEEQLNRGTEMTRIKFIRLSGWGLILAAVALLLTFLPESDEILDGLYQIFGAPTVSTQHNLVHSLAAGVRSLPFPIAILLITLGLVGLRAHYGERSGTAGKMALGAGILCGAASFVSSIWMARPITNILMAFMFAGLFVFGLAALRVKPMRRGNGLPALAGLWWPLLVILACVFPQFMQRLGPVVPLWFSFTIFSAMSLSLALLGYMLHADTAMGDEVALLQV